MKLHMDFRDDATDMMEAFVKINLGLVKEGLSRASSQLAGEYKRILKAEEPSGWGSVSRNGKRRLSLLERKKQFGQKYNRETGKIWTSSKGKPANIADHITFYTPKGLTSLYAVVGGGHKGFQPLNYVNGVVKGSFGEPIPSTSKATLEILDKLNNGAVVPLSREQRNFIATTEGISKVPFSVTYKARRFAERARSSGGRLAIQKIANLYAANFNKAVANINPKVTTRKTAS